MPSPVTVYIGAYASGAPVTADDLLGAAGAGYVSRAVLPDSLAASQYLYGSGARGEAPLPDGSVRFFWILAVDSAGNRSDLLGPLRCATLDTLAPAIALSAAGARQTPGGYEFVLEPGAGGAGLAENAANAVELRMVLSDAPLAPAAARSVSASAGVQPLSIASVAHPGSGASVALPPLRTTRYYSPARAAFLDASETTPPLYGHVTARDESGNESVASWGPFDVEDYTPPSGTVFLERSRFPSDTLTFRFVSANLSDPGSGVASTTLVYSPSADASSGTAVAVDVLANTVSFPAVPGARLHGFVRCVDASPNANVYEAPCDPAFLDGVVEPGLIVFLDADNPLSLEEGSAEWRNLVASEPAFAANVEPAKRVPDPLGLSGNLLRFDAGTGWLEAGKPQHVTLAGSPVPIASAFTFEVAFKTDRTEVQDIFTIYPDGVAAGRMQLAWAVGRVWIFTALTQGTRGRTVLENTGENTAPAGAWHHFAMRRTGDRVHMVLNGSLRATVNLEDPLFRFSTSPQILGEDASLASPDRPFRGFISLVKVYDRALSDAELAQNFDAVRGRFGIPRAAA